MRLLLMSNATAPGFGFLEHAHRALSETLIGVRTVTFVPFALADHDAYTDFMAKAMEPLDIEVIGAHTADPAERVRAAEALFVGGGNTFRLVATLHRAGLMDLMRQRVADGVPFIGSSAGSNVACPTMRTTNDMPIVAPPSLDTLGLVPFQLNPHYLDAPPDADHRGESREQRIVEFLEENDVPVLGIREGTWVERDGRKLTLGGIDVGARLFTRGTEPAEIATGTDLSHLLDTVPRFDT